MLRVQEHYDLPVKTMLLCSHKVNNQFSGRVSLLCASLSRYCIHLRVSHQIHHCLSPTQTRWGLRRKALFCWSYSLLATRFSSFHPTSLSPGEVKAWPGVGHAARRRHGCGTGSRRKRPFLPLVETISGLLASRAALKKRLTCVRHNFCDCPRAAHWILTPLFRICALSVTFQSP